MRLSWNEIKARSARFSDEWKDAHYEKGESQTFYNEFFEVFGVTRRRVATFEEPVKKLGEERGFIDLGRSMLQAVLHQAASRSPAIALAPSCPLVEAVFQNYRSNRASSPFNAGFGPMSTN